MTNNKMHSFREFDKPILFENVRSISGATRNQITPLIVSKYLLSVYRRDIEYYYEKCAPLLMMTYNKDIDIIYEFIMDLYGDITSQKDLNKLIKYIDYHFTTFTRKVSEVAMCQAFKDYFTRSSIKNSDLNTLMCGIYSCMCQYYGNGDIIGFDGKKVYRSHAIGKYDISSLETVALINIMLRDNFSIKDAYFIFNTSKDKIVFDAIKKSLGSSFITDMKNSIKDSWRQLVSSSSNAIPVVLTGFLMNNYPTENMSLDTAVFVRENIQEVESPYFNVCNTFLGTMFHDNNPLLNRKVYVKDNGIIIHLKENLDDVNSIQLREVHKFGNKECHYIDIIATMETDGYEYKRYLTLSLNDFKEFNMFNLYEIDYTIILLVCSWLGINNHITGNIERLFNNEVATRQLDNNIATIDKYKNEGLDFFKEILETVERIVRDDNVWYEVPYSWNYNNGSTNRGTKHQDGVVLEKLTNVARYSRRLPQGQQASDSAKELAKKYRISLEDGKTLVDDFVRTVKYKLGD